MDPRAGANNPYARYAMATWSSARWSLLLTASATQQLVRHAGHGPGAALHHSRHALRWAQSRARQSFAHARSGQWPRPTALVEHARRAKRALSQRGVSMLGLSASAGLCIALGAFAPVELVRWAAACALCAAVVVREHAREQLTDALRARVDALEARVLAAQRSARVELVDVELLDEQALVTARQRSLALASEASDELDLRRAFAFGAPEVEAR